jgi:hypothetical protein
VRHAIKTGDIAMAFSIKQFLFAIAIFALGLVALLNADLPLIAETIEFITFMELILVGYGIWVSAGEQRAFRIGFLAWGGLYFIATKWWQIALSFATGKLIQAMALSFEPTRISDLHGSGDPYLAASGDWLNRFEVIGHCLFALLLGLIGGCITVYFYRKRQKMLDSRV